MQVHIFLTLLAVLQGFYIIELDARIKRDVEGERRCPGTQAKTMDGNSCYECGKSQGTSQRNETIVAQEGDIPWNALLFKNDRGRWFLLCMGTLITSRVVLTGARCIVSDYEPHDTLEDPKAFMVALGKVKPTWDNVEPHEIKRNVTEIRVPGKYMSDISNKTSNDIALLFLKSKVPINNLVMPACLDFNPTQFPDYRNITGYVVDTFITVATYIGAVDVKDGSHMLHDNTPLMTFTECLERSHPSEDGPLTPDKFCIDSVLSQDQAGVGLTVTYHGLHYVTGVGSYHVSGQDRAIATFTNVSLYMDWIKQNLPQED